MRQRVQLHIFDHDREIWQGPAEPPIEIGRQQEGDAAPPELQNAVSCRRLVIAPLSARAVPRQAIRIEVGSPGTLRVVNIHPRLTVGLGTTRAPLPPGGQIESQEPLTVYLPDEHRVFVRLAEADQESDAQSVSPEEQTQLAQYRTLATAAQTSAPQPPVRLRELLDQQHAEARGRAAVQLVRSALAVVRQAAGSDEFYEAAAQAAAEMIELDRAMVLLNSADAWTVRAVYYRDQSTSVGAPERSYSETLLRRAVASGQTAIFEPARTSVADLSSLRLLDRAVASPIFDQQQKVVGILYGDRRMSVETEAKQEGSAIGDLEAALFEVLAGAISSGLARQRQEAMRAALSQFFSPHVAERLERDQDLLAGVDAEVSVLFCDIRAFSEVTDRAGPERTIAWINDVLTELSTCVLAEDGVLVDYVGDELMAMFGMPGKQPDHAARACRAACEMLRRVEPLRERWQTVSPQGFGIGIGISTGLARVGNTGSRIKFKYGPLGNTVNLASRTQGATKQLGVSALITASTAAAIGDCFPIRRLQRVRVIGIAEAVEMYELVADPPPQWTELRQRYEAALEAYQTDDPTRAAQYLAELLRDHPQDRPSLLMFGRVVERMTQPDKPHDSVWTLDRK